MAKIKAKKTLFITIDGKPHIAHCNGRFTSFASVKGDMNEKLLSLCVMRAIQEQNWKISDEPVYLYIRLWYSFPYESVKRFFKPGIVAPTQARIDSILEIVMNAIVGKVIRRPSLVVSLNIEKRYTKHEPRMEIFIGVPSTWEELDNDLSYAEETSEELEEQQE